VGALVLAVGAVLMYGSGEAFERKMRYVLHFEDSVDGLSPGSPVKLRGVEIGKVEDVYLQADPESFEFTAPVTIVIFPSRIEGSPEEAPAEAEARKNLERLVDRGLRASLVSESVITGQLSVKLDFLPETEARFVGVEGPYPELPTVRTGLSKFIDEVQQIPLKKTFEDLDATILELREMIESVNRRLNQGDINRAIGDAAEAIGDFRDLVAAIEEKTVPLLDSLTSASDQVRDTLTDASETMDALQEDFHRVAESMDRTLGTIDELAVEVKGEVDPTMELVRGTLEKVKEGVTSFSAATDRLDRLLRDDSTTMEILRRALIEFTESARGLKNLLDALERRPEALIRGK
jgi:paraquat-inducible protein B